MDPLLEAYRNLRCPTGSRAELDLDAERVGCFTLGGEEVAPLTARARLGVVGWAAIIAGVAALAAEALRWRR